GRVEMHIHPAVPTGGTDATRLDDVMVRVRSAMVETLGPLGLSEPVAVAAAAQRCGMAASVLRPRDAHDRLRPRAGLVHRVPATARRLSRAGRSESRRPDVGSPRGI